MTTEPYDFPTRLIHFLLAALGVAALVSGQFAGDYRRPAHPGFDIHREIGLATAVAIALRLVWGLVAQGEARFSRWVPFTRERLRLAWQDVRDLARLRLPQRAGHAGLSGLVQALGLLAFLWMAATGSVLYAFLEPGARVSGWLGAVRELHEGGQAAVLTYLFLHVGAVIAHAIAGESLWRRIAPWPARRVPPA
jgi:cytochrome b